MRCQSIADSIEASRPGGAVRTGARLPLACGARPPQLPPAMRHRARAQDSLRVGPRGPPRAPPVPRHRAHAAAMAAKHASNMAPRLAGEPSRPT
eukprot:1115492-Prorocentrum_minimum.AAC.4